MTTTTLQIGILVHGDEARVTDNPMRDDLVAVRFGPIGGLNDACIQGTLADVRRFLTTALAGVDEIAATRAAATTPDPEGATA